MKASTETDQDLGEFSREFSYMLTLFLNPCPDMHFWPLSNANTLLDEPLPSKTVLRSCVFMTNQCDCSVWSYSETILCNSWLSKQWRIAIR